MKSLKTTLVLLAFLLAGLNQTFAQCGNTIINPAQVPTIPQMGQSFKVCSDSPGKLTSITIKRLAKILNTERSGTLKIFRGEFEGANRDGDLMYSQNVTLAALKQAETVERVTFKLEGGQGSLDYLPGETYTFYLELNERILPSAHYGNPYKDGKGFMKVATNPSWDFYFEIGFEEDFCGNTIINPVQAPTIPEMGQSFKMCSDKAGILTSITIQRLAKVWNTKRTGTLKVFRGEFEGANRDGDLMYTQNVILDELPLSESKHDVKLKLEGGEGTLAYEPGKTYTFYLELDQRILVGANYANPYKDGKGFMKVATNPSWDFYFKVGYKEIESNKPDITNSTSNWQYGYGSNIAGSFTQFTLTTADARIKRISQGTDAKSQWWSVAQNVTSASITDSNSITYPAKADGVLVMHPGPGRGDRTKVKYTAPATGTYNVSVEWTLVDNQPNVSVIAEVLGESAGAWSNLSTLKLTGYNKPQTYNGIIQLQKGESILFEIENDGNYGGDSTRARFNISKQ